MKAVIMAGGEGQRLRPLTCDKPKPMIDFFGKPVMEHIIELLKKHGITQIAVTLQYMPQVIMNYFGTGEAWGVQLEYFIENSPLGTAGSVKNAEEFLGDEFVVISGDCVTDINLTEAIDFHHEKNATATLVLSKVDNPLEYGIVVTNEKGDIERFLEKPNWSQVFTNTANTGIYIINSAVLQTVQKNKKTDWSQDVFPYLLAENYRMAGYVSDAYWCDVGDTSAYAKAHRDRLMHYISPQAQIALSAKIGEPVWIGDGVQIGENAGISPYSIVGAATRIDSGASLKQAIIGKNVIVKNNAALRGAIIDNGAIIGQHTGIFEDSVVGSNAKIGKFCSITSGSKIWANKEVEDGLIIDENIAWGNNKSYNLFGERTIDGEINVDITPEYASKLGAALGNLFGKGGGRIAVGYGSAPALIMLKNSLVSGIISSGCDVLDINPTTLPITRNATMFYSCSAGIYLAGVGVAVPGAPSKIVAHILDGNGLDCLPSRERALEQLFVRNDFARINPQNLGKITEIKDYNMFYIHQIKGQADMDINITSAEPVVANVGKTVLQNMGVNIYNIISSRNIGFEIDEAGEIATIIDEKSKKLTEYEKFYLMIDILGQTENKIVLPLSAPMALRNKARQMGFKIIDSKTSDADMLHTLHKNGLTYQYGLMFDGVFLTSQVCQYFSRTGRKLTDYIKKIPPVYVASKEIEVPISIKGEIVQKLSRQEKEADLTQGVKIDKGNSWVMVVPHKKRASVVITAEGADMEAAEELIAEYGDKIF